MVPLMDHQANNGKRTKSHKVCGKKGMVKAVGGRHRRVLNLAPKGSIGKQRRRATRGLWYFHKHFEQEI